MSHNRTALETRLLVVESSMTGADMTGSAGQGESDPLEAWQEIYASQFPSLVRTAFLLTGSSTAAEDIVQDAFLRCAKRLGDADAPQAYLRAAVVNGALDERRRRTFDAEADLPERVVLSESTAEVHDVLVRLAPRPRAAVV